MLARNKSFEILGGNLGVSRTTVWRWANEQWRLDPGKIEALADAIGLDSPVDLYRPPGRESIDGVLGNATEEVYQATLDVARRLAGRSK